VTDRRVTIGDLRYDVPEPAARALEDDAVAAERERITAEVGAIEAHRGMVERPAVLAIVNPEAAP
jgi:hypothetical protein